MTINCNGFKHNAVHNHGIRYCFETNERFFFGVPNTSNAQHGEDARSEGKGNAQGNHDGVDVVNHAFRPAPLSSTPWTKRKKSSVAYAEAKRRSAMRASKKHMA